MDQVIILMKIQPCYSGTYKKIYNAKVNNLKSVDVWGSGIAKREFLYVDDLVNALVLAMEKYDSSEPVNIGTGSTISIKNLVKKSLLF